MNGHALREIGVQFHDGSPSAGHREGNAAPGPLADSTGGAPTTNSATIVTLLQFVAPIIRPSNRLPRRF